MSADDLDDYEAQLELALYKEYRDVVGSFAYVVETERRFYFANHVDLKAHNDAGDVYFELTLRDACVGQLPDGTVHQDRARADVQGRQHRGDREVRSRTADGDPRLRLVLSPCLSAVAAPRRRSLWTRL